MAEFSDDIVNVDDGGDQSLISIDFRFPVFALLLRVVKKHDCVRSVVQAVQALKFRYWGRAIVLHEHGIRYSKGDFTVRWNSSRLFMPSR